MSHTPSSGNISSALEQQLRELAMLDWPRFCEVTGIDKLQALVCLELEKGKSMSQIAQKAKVTKRVVENRCKKCPGKATQP